MRLTQSEEPPEVDNLPSDTVVASNGSGPTGAVLGGGLQSDTAMLVDPFGLGSYPLAASMVDEPFPSVKNGHAKGLSNGSTNGSTTHGSLSPRVEHSGDPLGRHPLPIARVNPPGTTLYPGSATNREEFVRLVIQTLRDVGYV